MDSSLLARKVTIDRTIGTGEKSSLREWSIDASLASRHIGSLNSRSRERSRARAGEARERRLIEKKRKKKKRATRDSDTRVGTILKAARSDFPRVARSPGEDDDDAASTVAPPTSWIPVGWRLDFHRGGASGSRWLGASRRYISPSGPKLYGSPAAVVVARRGVTGCKVRSKEPRDTTRVHVCPCVRVYVCAHVSSTRQCVSVHAWSKMTIGRLPRAANDRKWS